MILNFSWLYEGEISYILLIFDFSVFCNQIKRAGNRAVFGVDIQPQHGGFIKKGNLKILVV